MCLLNNVLCVDTPLPLRPEGQCGWSFIIKQCDCFLACVVFQSGDCPICAKTVNISWYVLV